VSEKEWWIEYIRNIFKNEFHGKIVLNCSGFDIPNIEKIERVNKPKGKDNG
jgi:hypothetical protein